jgi:hypothetical protein
MEFVGVGHARRSPAPNSQRRVMTMIWQPKIRLIAVLRRSFPRFHGLVPTALGKIASADLNSIESGRKEILGCVDESHRFTEERVLREIQDWFNIP